MLFKFTFCDTDGADNLVEYRVLESEGSFKRYGIVARIISDEKVVEEESVESKFFTREEAEETIKMLCKFQVTPCTLKDVV